MTRVGLFTARHTGEAVAQTVLAGGVDVVARHHVATGWWGTAGIDQADDVFAANPDIVVSALTDHLFTQAEIDSVPGGIWNLHPAPLPRYRGCNSYSHAIIEGQWRYGVTLHRVDAGIDTGPVVEVRYFPIPEKATARVLHDMAQLVAVALFAERWPEIACGGVLTHRQDDDRACYYRRSSLEPFRELAAWPVELRDKIRRGLTFPPHPMPKEPA